MTTKTAGKIPFQFYLSKARDLEKQRLREQYGNFSEKLLIIEKLQQSPRLILGTKLRHDGQVINGTVSIQASEMHYCQPRETLEFHRYESFEIGFPTLGYFSKEILAPYGDSETNDTPDVYSCVPCDVVQEYIDTLLGIVGFVSQGNIAVPLEVTEEDMTYYSLL